MATICFFEITFACMPKASLGREIKKIQCYQIKRRLNKKWAELAGHVLP
jgi:hypothetical protein